MPIAECAEEHRSDRTLHSRPRKPPKAFDHDVEDVDGKSFPHRSRMSRSHKRESYHSRCCRHPAHRHPALRGRIVRSVFQSGSASPGLPIRDELSIARWARSESLRNITRIAPAKLKQAVVQRTRSAFGDRSRSTLTHPAAVSRLEYGKRCRPGISAMSVKPLGHIHRESRAMLGGAAQEGDLHAAPPEVSASHHLWVEHASRGCVKAPIPFYHPALCPYTDSGAAHPIVSE